MPSKTVSTRLDAREVRLIESLANLTGVDRSTLIKSLLRRGMSELRLEQGVEAYRQGRVTLSRAAEIAGVSAWDFVARMKDRELQLHYDVDEFEADVDALASES